MFDTLIHELVGVANDITQSLQATVTHQSYASQDEWQKPTYNAAVPRTAVVQRSTRWIRTKDNTTRQARYKLTFLANVPIDGRDLITLPDGTTGPILIPDEALLDSSGVAYLTEVEIG